MGHPRLGDDAEEIRKLDWEIDLLERLAARKARRGQTPPMQAQVSVTEADQLAEEAAILRQAAIVRVTPPSEKETVCLRSEKELESSIPSSSTASTAEELTPGEFESLVQKATDVRATLEAKRLRRLTSRSNGPT